MLNVISGYQVLKQINIPIYHRTQQEQSTELFYADCVVVSGLNQDNKNPEYVLQNKMLQVLSPLSIAIISCHSENLLAKIWQLQSKSILVLGIELSKYWFTDLKSEDALIATDFNWHNRILKFSYAPRILIADPSLKQQSYNDLLNIKRICQV